MEIVAAGTPAAFERAIAAARQVGEGDDLVAGLAAPLDAALRGRIAEAWDAVESALRQARQRGAERTHDLAEAAAAKIESLLQQAGARARDLEQALVARIQEYLRTLIDGALASVRDTLQIGTQTVQLASVEISQRITLGGSLKASIQEICAATATGELTINAQYTTPTS